MDIETVDIAIRKKIANRRIRFNSENLKKFIIQKIRKLELKNLNFKVFPRSVN